MELLDGKGILHVWAQLGLTSSPMFTSGKEMKIQKITNGSKHSGMLVLKQDK